VGAAFPHEILSTPRWCFWDKTPRPDGRPSKKPLNPKTGYGAQTDAPSTFTDFETAAKTALADERAGGVGFLLTGGEWIGIDLDHVIDATTGEVNAKANELLGALSPTYVERSPGGDGLHVLLRGSKPRDEGWPSMMKGAFGPGTALEVYDGSDGRYFTATGDVWNDAPINDASADDIERIGSLLRPKDRVDRGGTEARAPAPVRRATHKDDEDDFARARWGLLECRILSADDGYNDAFLRVLAALKGAFGDQGLRLAHEWCRLNPATYNGPEVDRRWATLNGTGMQCLAGMFDDARPGWRQECPTGRNHAHRASRDRQAPRDAGQSHDVPTSPSDGQRVALGNRDPATGRIVLSTTQTLPSAKEFIAEHFTRDGMTTLVSYAGQFWAWSNNHYTAIEDEAIRQILYPWLQEALRYNAKGRLIDFDSNPRTVEAVRSTIASTSFVQASEHLPFWRGNGAPPAPVHDLLLCRGLSLHIPTRRRIAPTPELFAVNALDFDYSEAAKEPTRWLAFLRELFGDDIEAINLLQEWMGYCLTSDTRQQKILLIVGPRRSGKGTIGRVIRKVVGEGNVANPTASSLATNFGLWPLIGKTNAIISDARFSGHWVTVVIERLLCISGEDSISIDRKFMAPVNMKLPTRFTLFTNELPRLPDASNALTGRFLVLRLKHSFYGKEDVALSDKLTSETPGILNWALEGWDRLNKRGHFLQPSSSQQALEDLEELASPVSTFVRESCIVAPEQRVPCSELYNAWLSWCSERDANRDPISAQTFGRDLKAAMPVRCRGNGKTGRFYEGIGLRAGGSS